MNYQEFVYELKEKVKDILGDTRKVEIVTTLKNNDLERIGLTIIDSNVNISPTIYLEEFYQYHNSISSLDYIAEEVVALYHEIEYDQDIDLSYITDFDSVKSSIGYKLISSFRNEKFLENLPHKYYIEFAIVFVLFLKSDSNGQGTILINNDMLRMWDKDIDEIYEIAHQNMPRLFPFSLVPMHEMICEFLDDEDSDFLEDSPLYILTNMQRTLGASTFLYDEAFPYVAKKLKESFYILPSSIHELIIVPESISPGWEALDNMIETVNYSQLSPEERLGENAYYYDAVLHRLH